MGTFIEIQNGLVQSGNEMLIENIKLLLFKFDPDIFDRIDFDNDSIYQEPLLFAFFNSDSQNIYSLNSILAKYYLSNDPLITISIESDLHGRIYLPGLGWMITRIPNQVFVLNCAKGELKLTRESIDIEFRFEPIEFIEGTRIELLKYPLSLLDRFYYDPYNNIVEVEIEEVSAKQNNHLKLAFDLIRQHAPQHLQLIEAVVTKCVIFNVDTALRNSFATLSAQGIGFFNSYQDTYNEVFFVDDIAHQTGHVIFNALIYEVENFIAVSPALVLDTVVLSNGSLETRDVYTIFHALYTYYATFICLDACLKVKAFIGYKKHEAMGRMAFYIRKCYSDIGLIEKPKNGEYPANKLFTPNGLVIYNELKSIFMEMAKEWGPQVKHFDLSNQPYNFNYSIFLASNPIDELS
ncbi:hypothetical protein HDE69_000596 [Pedobacter cryoconitis]|uniref:HEXXH motif-containing protein n=1 Tax=Pedobacter cryoconitis TaxID=188932 RepID=A0A7W8YQA7_9SPHI|nr:hypothetical protein [Pedobacter cryoconitis]MBB5619560.1 hypothetical protein [Pedobacter cryoconitis]